MNGKELVLKSEPEGNDMKLKVAQLRTMSDMRVDSLEELRRET